MKHEEYCYVDCAYGSIKNRNHVIKISDFVRQEGECYITWHRFSEDYLRYYEKNKKSVSLYNGPSCADFLPIDFDGSDLEEIKSHVLDFLCNLDSLGVDGGVRVYFSGCKGFHVLLDAELFGGFVPSQRLAGQLRDLAKRLAGNLIRFDPSIYDRNRMLRTSDSLNAKTGLYKVGITRQELELSMAHIKDFAESPRKMVFPSWGDVNAADGLVDLFRAVCLNSPQSQPQVASDYLPTGMKEGDGRDNTAFRLARDLRDHRFDRNKAFQWLTAWNNSQQDKLTDKDLWVKIESAYSRGAEEDIGYPVDIDQGLIEYQKEIKKRQEGRAIFTGFDLVDEAIGGILPGYVMTLMARSGVGKTMLALNICRLLGTQYPDLLCMFASLEMPLSGLIERWLMMANNKYSKEIRQSFMDGTQGTLIIEMIKQLGDKLLLWDNRLSIETIKPAIERAFGMRGRTVDLLIIDYLGLMDMKGKDTYEAVSKVAKGIKQAARENDVAIILLCQVGREHGTDGSKPLTKHSARDSGAIEESADYLIGAYRPEMTGKENDKIFLQILKNRGGPENLTFSHFVHWETAKIHHIGKDEGRT